MGTAESHSRDLSAWSSGCARQVPTLRTSQGYELSVESQIVQRKNQNCGPGPNKTSANPAGSSRPRIVPKGVPCGTQMARPSYSCLAHSPDVGHPRKDMSLGEVGLSSSDRHGRADTWRLTMGLDSKSSSEGGLGSAVECPHTRAVHNCPRARTEDQLGPQIVQGEVPRAWPNRRGPCCGENSGSCREPMEK